MFLRFRGRRKRIFVILILIMVVYVFTHVFPSVPPYLKQTPYDADPSLATQEFHPDKNSLLVVTACSRNHFIYLNYMLYSLKQLDVWVIFYDIGKR